MTRNKQFGGHLKLVAITLCGLATLSTPTPSFAQTDSLQQLLDTPIDWKEKIQIHHRLAIHYRSRDTSLAVFHLGAMDSIAEAVQDDNAFYQAAKAKGSYYSKITQYDKSRIELNKALHFANQIDSIEASSILSNIGILKYYQNDFDSAQHFLDSAYQINLLNPDAGPETLVSNLNALGVVSRKRENYEDAMIYQQEALKLARGLNSERHILSALNSMAGLYTALGNSEEALNYDQQIFAHAKKTDNLYAMATSSRNIGMYFLDNGQDSAVIFFTNAQDYFDQIGNQVGVIESTISLGDYYNRKKDYPKSIEYFQQAEKSARDIDDQKLLSNALTNAGEVYFNQNKFDKAEDYLLQGLAIDQNLGRKHALNESYQSLVILYERISNWEQAHFYSKKHKILSDSINDAKYNDRVKTLELEFETERKDAEINQQKLTINNQQTQKKFMLGLFSVTSLLLLLGLIAFFYRNKKNKLISQQNLEIKTQKINELEKEKKILSMASMIEGQESERKRIAQDLHDGLGGLLSVIKVKFDVIQKQISELESINVYEQTSSMIDEACSEVRKIAHNMMPDSLAKLGLVEAVTDIGTNSSDLGIEVINLGMHTLTETQNIMLYRVIQEFVANTRKHAGASKVIVQFSKDDKSTSIYLEDDGSGFDIETITEKGLGLNSMRSRINFLGGSYELDSKIGVGTSLQIIVPKSTT